MCRVAEVLNLGKPGGFPHRQFSFLAKSNAYWSRYKDPFFKSIRLRELFSYHGHRSRLPSRYGYYTEPARKI